LPNGAIVLVERHPQAKSLYLHLFVSSQTTLETPETHGLHHLLEHLEAKGRDREVDRELELHGALLTAETFRDATAYTINLRPTDLSLGLRAISSVMQLGPVTKEQVSREAEIIRQEQALEDVTTQISVDAWRLAYGDQGLDPSGDLDVISHATPEALAKLHGAEFVGPNLVLLVVGNVDLDATTRSAAAVLSGAAPGASVGAPMRTATADVPVGAGRAVALRVTDFNSSQTASRLAAAFGLASRLTDAFVTYTPSQRGGLIIFGSTSEGDVRTDIATVRAQDLFATGRALAKAWLNSQIGAESTGFLRGLLLSQGAGVRPETMTDNLSSMTVADFAAAVQEWKGSRSVSIP
jgi:hypothetical protein